MIPNVFHLCYGLSEDFGGKPFSLVHYIAVKSAYEINKPCKIFFYYKYEPQTEWWEKTLKYVDLIKVEPPENIFGNKLYHVAHKADIIRLQVLLDQGGIYLDLDTICKKSFSTLLDNKFVIGKQGRFRKMGLCNAVILSEKNSEFARIWYESYKNFRSKGRNKYWAEHSVAMPMKIAKDHPGLLHIEPYSSFHFPLYYSFSLKKLFLRNYDYPKAYCHHLWESGSWQKYLSKLTVENIKSKDTTYNVIARKYL